MSVIWLLSSVWAAPGDADRVAREIVAEPPFSWSSRVFSPRVGPEWVRLVARVDGIEVVGSDRVVAVAGGRALRVYGASLEWPTGEVRLSESDARGAAQDLARRLGDGLLFEPRARQVVFGGRRAWQVDLGTRAPLRTWRTYVDAETGALLHTEPTSREALGRVFAGSPATSQPEDVALPRLTSTEGLTGTWADAVTCDESTIEPGIFGAWDCHHTTRLAVPDEDGNYLYEPAPESLEDAMAEVGAYYHLDRVAQWTVDTYGISMPETMKVHVNFPMQNAFFGDFDGDGLNDVSLGQSDDGIDFAYDADVVYHEYGHAFVAQVGRLGFVNADEFGLDWTAGGLNEGTADVLSMLITGDPDLAEYAGTAGGDEGPIRQVSEDRHCPEDLYGEVHRNGMLLGALFWNLLDDEALPVEKAEALLFGAVQCWEQHPGWPGAAACILDTADLLAETGDLDGAEIAAIERQIEAFGLADCPRVLDLGDGEEHAQMLMNLGLYEDFSRIPGEIQYRFEVPQGASAVTFRADRFETREPPLGWAMYARKGEPVGHRVQRLDVLGIAVAVPEDWDVEATGDTEGTGLRLNDLVPGDTWYVSVASVNTGELDLLEFASGEIVVRVDVEDVQVRAEGEPARACACGTSSGGIPGPMLAAAALVFARRSRGDARRRVG